MWRRIAPVLLAAGLISIACAVLVLLPVSKQASSTRRLREDVLIGASEIASRLPAPKARRGSAPHARAVEELGSLHRVVLATIPRSGNGWFRGMLEASAGLATQSVFMEGDSVFDPRTQAHVTACGWLGDCSRVRGGPSRPGDPVVVKTHFPFVSDARTTPHIPEMVAKGVSDVKGDIDYLILPVRNPLDNFDAWRRYLDRRGPEFKSKQDHQTLAAFTEAWLQFHNFWFAQNIPITTYRYEDITDNPLLVLESALRSSGIWALRNLTESTLMHVANVTRLHTYRGKLLGANVAAAHQDDVSKNYKKFSTFDIQWILETHRPVLRRYGYDMLYDVWLSARQLLDEGVDEAEVDRRFARRFNRVMQQTSKYAAWAEHWNKRAPA